jgi:hypothetical protein
MQRVKIIIILCLIGSLIYGQSDSDFPVDLIKAAQIDSCIIKCDAANYPQKYYFDNDGRIITHSFPTSYLPLNHSVIYGIHITTYYYDPKGRLFKKTEKADFGIDSINMPEILTERFIYDFDNKLITHLFYFSFLTKVVTFEYENNQLISETTYNFSESSGSKQPKTQTSKTFYQNNKWSRYDDEGNIQDSSVTITDSAHYIKTSCYYNFNKNRIVEENPEEYNYLFDNQWQMKEIVHKYGDNQSTDKIYRTENGLITEIEHLGGESHEFIFEYK